jgi:gluconate 2-dehydrogenase alpha chain
MMTILLTSHGLLTLNAEEARLVTAIAERLFPADESGPGATEINVLTYIDRALAGAYQSDVETYRLGLAVLDGAARTRHGASFTACTPEQQDELLAAMESGTLHEMQAPSPQAFLELLRTHTQEGLFADPLYGGNRDKLGWRVLRHPGVWLENSAEENLSAEPVTKGGVIQSLADLDLAPPSQSDLPPELANYDPQRGAALSHGTVDVVLVGLGAMGGLVAPILTQAGLKVVALEAGPWRTSRDFLPDELGSTFYSRATMGPKFASESPRWRRHAAEATTQPAMFSFGRMMNSVGGSVIHYGAWLRRFHPFHFKAFTRVREMWGTNALPEDCSLVDWPIDYQALEPYYTAVEKIVGVAGDDTNPFTPRSEPYPMPPLRPFRLGESFRHVTTAMGLHPYPVPVGMNSVAYDGRPATTYTAWSNGFGSFNNAKWNPSLSSVPQALATGNLDLRTHCRAIRICTDRNGHANGVEYVDALGNRQIQQARTVILSSFVFENVRLLLLSGDGRHPDGLGNNTGQVGKHYMTKQFAHVDGDFPHVFFNRHTGPNSQAVIVDDFVSQDFDSLPHGFIGGATIGVENQFLPIQISREVLPPGVRRWGKPYKDFIRQWQHYGVIAIQSDALPYASHTLDLDPEYRDRSGLGLPVIRITYDLRENEQRLAAWMMAKAEECLRAMGATRTWCGPSFTGVCSSHDLGGCRMGDDPATSVVDVDLRVHDTPGLYVFSGAVFPSCPGVNPNLTIWALVHRAADRLVEKLRTNRGDSQ